MTFCGSSARRWIRASVCSTESCTRAAMSARSSARTRAWRSSTRSRAIRSHHGPSSSTMPAMHQQDPAERPQQGQALVRRGQPARAAEHQQARDRQPDAPSAWSGPAGPAAEPSGSASRRSVACSSGEPFRQISTSPATVTTCGHA